MRTKEQAMRELIPKSCTVSQPQKGDTLVQHSKSIYSNIFEDADAFPDNKSNAEILSELKGQTDAMRNSESKISSNSVDSEGTRSNGMNLESPLSNDPPSNNLDTTEDWDKEIEDSLAYNLVLETFKERSCNKVYFQNQLQNLLYSYPPASQAFTKTANYESAIYSSSLPPPCSMQPSSMADTGQFDDADEDVGTGDCDKDFVIQVVDNDGDDVSSDDAVFLCDKEHVDGLICSDFFIVVVGDGDVRNSSDDASTSDDGSVNDTNVKLAGVDSFCKLPRFREEETVLNFSSEAETEFEALSTYLVVISAPVHCKGMLFKTKIVDRTITAKI